MNKNKLMDLAKQSLSIISSSSIKDGEIEMWINAGKEDLKRQGINSECDNPLIISAIIMFVKANFGNVDLKEKENSQKTYNLLCHSLGLSDDYKVVDNNA